MLNRAVGGAVGHNPVSIIVPCHRVVGTNGSLTGYAGGIDKKEQLLRHEGADLSRLFRPAASHPAPPGPASVLPDPVSVHPGSAPEKSEGGPPDGRPPSARGFTTPGLNPRRCRCMP